MSTASGNKTFVGRSRPWILAAALTIVGILGGIGIYHWSNDKSLPPPTVNTASADPEVAAAISEARTSVIQSPRSADAWGRLGMVLRAHDYGEEANYCLAEAERRNPKEPRWPYLQGLTLMLTNPDEGIAKLRRAVELCGDSPPAPRLRLGEALLSTGQFQEAEECFRLAIRLDPGGARAQIGAAQVRYQRNDLSACMHHLRRAEAAQPGRKDVRQLMSQARLRSGESLSSAEQLELSRMPDDPPWPDPFVAEVQRLQVGLSPRLAEAHALLSQNRAVEALAKLEDAVRVHPNSDRAWLALGQTRGRLKEYPAAETALLRALQLRPNSVETWFQLGVIQFLQSKHVDALESFRKVVEHKLDHTLAHYNIGHCLKELGKRAEAIDAFRAALRFSPDYAPAQKALDELQARSPN